MIKNFLKNHKFEVILGLFILVYALYFTTASFLRYDNFYTGRFDLGNMDQAVWNSIHGRIFQITDPNGTDIISRLSFHADFILVLISPLYLIWSNPKMLLLLQTIVLAFGAIYIYLISERLLKNKSLSLVFSVIFLLNPALEYANLYDFHPVTLATTFLLAAFYHFLKKEYRIFILFAVLAGLTKEDVWLIITIFGIAFVLRSIWESRLRREFIKKFEFLFGSAVFIISASLFYFLVWYAIPAAHGSNHFALSYYSDFGASPTGIVKNIILNPIKVISSIFHNGSLSYLLELFSPLGFLPVLFIPTLIFAAPDFLIDLLSNNVQLHQIYYQYSTTITPFLFISAIYGVYYLLKRFPKFHVNLICCYLLFTTLISAYILGPLPFSKNPNIAMFTKQLKNANAINDFIDSIPTKYSIAATNNIGSHLSRRQLIYTIPVGINKADVILFLLNDPSAQPSLQAQKDMAKEMEQDKNYEQVYKLNDFVVFEKRGLYTGTLPKPKKGQVKLFPYSIPALIDRKYTKSNITIEKEVSANGNFRSYIISFISDGLKEYSLMNIPTSTPPANGFPVLIIDHGYIQPGLYDTVNSYKSESDYFANNGFLVLKPDYRGNGNSEVSDKALMRFEYPIDVLNLISSVENIKNANNNEIFLWSHSMGGEVTLEVLEVAAINDDFSSKIKGAVFWAPVTDPVKWFSRSHLSSLPEALITPYPYTQTFQILGTPDQNPELWRSLSPLNYLKNINVPILLQHGTGDTTVPYSWSVELSNDLKTLDKNVQFISYPDDNHNLPLHWSDAINSDLNFYQSHL